MASTPSLPSSLEGLASQFAEHLSRLYPEETAKLRREVAVLGAYHRDLGAVLPGADDWQRGVLCTDSRQVLLCCSRQAGKSTVAAALALQAAILVPDSLVLLLSPTLRQSGELFRDKVMRLYTALGKPVAPVGLSALELKLANGSRIVSLPGNEETIRGYSGVSLLIIDEAARVSDELYRSVRPMLATSGGRLVALSTPFGKRGWFHDEWHGQGPWQRVRVTAPECPRIPASFLAEERRAMGDEWYSQEYLCAFNAATGTPLFPPEWLALAVKRASELAGQKRAGIAVGVDPGEGGANTSFACVDRLGLLDLKSIKTPDTSVIAGEALGMAKRFGVPDNMILFDRGGGGFQIVNDMKARKQSVRAVGFGEMAVGDAPRAKLKVAVNREARYSFQNLRAQMYYELRLLLDPATGSFGLPGDYPELHRQLAPMPLLFDKEGRIRMLQKNPRAGESAEKSLVELIGCSPDEADAVALAVHAMLHPEVQKKAGGLW